MEFALEQRRVLLRDAIKDFVKKECPPTLIREIDQKGEWPAALYGSLSDLGYLGIPFPEEYDGVGGDTFDVALVAEELAYGCYALAVAFRQSIVLGGGAVVLGGSDSLKRAVLPAVANGEKILAWALTEADIASDSGYITTTARNEGDALVVDGTKMFVYGADVADYCAVIARTSGEQNDPQGITALLVPMKGTKGISLKPKRKMGTWPVKAFEVKFDGVVVPSANVLGSIGEGWSLVQQVLDVDRITAASMSAGICQRMVDDAGAYAKQRVQFDTQISKFQAVAHMISDMLIDTVAMRWMAYRAAWMHTQGMECRKEAALAKLYCSNAAEKVGTTGVQVMGGYGYMAEFDMERYYRDARRESLTAGSSAVQRDLIAGLMGL